MTVDRGTFLEEKRFQTGAAPGSVAVAQTFFLMQVDAKQAARTRRVPRGAEDEIRQTSNENKRADGTPGEGAVAGGAVIFLIRTRLRI